MHSIDIMLPFWGEPAYLFETVQAVLSQDCTDWRLTVVDDCYPDPSVAEYFRNLADERISYLRNESNLGITANYEKCVSLATADLVMLLGCDDIPHPDFISRVLSMHDAFPAAAIIQPGVRIIDSTGSTVDPFVDRIKRLTMPRTRVPRLLSGEYLAALFFGPIGYTGLPSCSSARPLCLLLSVRAFRSSRILRSSSI